jgi:hypothetical protein
MPGGSRFLVMSGANTKQNKSRCHVHFLRQPDPFSVFQSDAYRISPLRDRREDYSLLLFARTVDLHVRGLIVSTRTGTKMAAASFMDKTGAGMQS